MSPLRFYRSTIGKKIIMAVTGLIGIGFLIVHMAGNLQVFESAQKLNAYAHFLHGPANELLQVLRVVLIVAVLLHILMAWQLTQRNRAARPEAYRQREPQVSTLASRTMRWGGVLLLVFIVFHILHFTTLDIRPAGPIAAGDVFANVTKSFRIWWVTLFYLVSMLFLGLHLYHGAWSSVRTLGLRGPSPVPLVRRVGGTIAIIIAVGFALVPLAVFVGWVK
jgi:succinate dehydrogenase / fumarate reductase cytochrome b subunit